MDKINWLDANMHIAVEMLGINNYTATESARIIGCNYDALKQALTRVMPELNYLFKRKSIYLTRFGSKVLDDAINKANDYHDLGYELGILDCSARDILMKYRPEMSYKFKRRNHERT